MTTPTIVPVTPELLTRFYGAPPTRTVHALAAVVDGEPLCVAGIFRQGDRRVVFADVSLRMRQEYPKTGVRLAHRVMREIVRRGTVFAIADAALEAAPRFLVHLGFTPVREGVYAWQA